MGVQINRDSEIKLHGKPRYKTVCISKEHLLCTIQNDLILKLPIFSKVGLPLCF